TVFNKWGSPVKEFSSYDRDKDRMWDGKSNGVDLPVAVYYYIIDFNGENGKQPRKGTVTIVR
ncbi:MAG: gliding motility-associated C-terminal domain-containing protein, partial [Cytophagales bacterium]|nr:gliding motility-associated C-terminal domain-containing protein [Cytophagales bacterium]